MQPPGPEDIPLPPKGKAGWPWTGPAHQQNPSNQDQQWPRVTVVTPSFNQATFLEETIRSVLFQHYPNLEYIVMDGGSTDGSLEIIKKYERHLAYWTSQKDSGAADAICQGFDRATGSILAYLNSDDVYLAGALRELVRYLQSTQSDVVYGNTYWIHEGGDVAAERRQTPFSRLAYLYGGADLQQPSTIWTNEIYRAVGGMNASFECAFDTDLFARFASKGAKFSHIRRFVSNARLHSSQKTEVLYKTSKKETSEIRSRYTSFSAGSFAGMLLRNIGRLQRTLWYVSQGDTVWLLSRIPDRLLSRTRAGTGAGPRSKSI